MDAVPQTTVISLHGIRTRGAWQKELHAALEDGGFKHRPLDFGFFRAISLAISGSRDKKVRWFLDEYTQIKATAPGPISIIAHSFGSYIVAKAMRKFSQIQFDRVILCGSIVPVSYDWDAIIAKRGQVREVLNQAGKQDVWVRIAEWAVPDAGPSGNEGFKNLAGGAVTQQTFTDYSHSEYFFDLNFRQNWIPFLQGKGIQPHYELTESTKNWKFRFLVGLISISFAAGLAYLFGTYWPRFTPGGSPPPVVAVPLSGPAALGNGTSVPPPVGNPTATGTPTNDSLPPPTRPPDRPKPEPPREVPLPTKPTATPAWPQNVFSRIQGEWQASNTYPAIQPPTAPGCLFAIAYIATMEFTRATSDSVKGSYEISERHFIRPANAQVTAPEYCNQQMTGNPATDTVEFTRMANVSVIAVAGDAADLLIRPEFYDCKYSNGMACPPIPPGASSSFPLRVLGDFERILINDMNFSRSQI